jgi:glucose-fructose oxidoreductase
MDSAGRDERFREVPEMTFGLLRFPRERLAMFGCSFGSADTSVCQIVGTEGSLRLEPAFDYAEGLVHHLVRDGRTWRRRYPKRDQFGAELRDFADCILEDREPEPSGVEGLADVRVIRALIQSAEEGRTITLPAFQRFRRPEPEQEIRLPPVRKPREIDVRSPSS